MDASFLRHPQQVGRAYPPGMTRREREVLEHAVHAVTEQAARADDLVKHVLRAVEIRSTLTIRYVPTIQGGEEHA